MEQPQALRRPRKAPTPPMPARPEVSSVLVIGSGTTVVAQAGSAARRVLVPPLASANSLVEQPLGPEIAWTPNPTAPMSPAVKVPPKVMVNVNGPPSPAERPFCGAGGPASNPRPWISLALPAVKRPASAGSIVEPVIVVPAGRFVNPNCLKTSPSVPRF